MPARAIALAGSFGYQQRRDGGEDQGRDRGIGSEHQHPGGPEHGVADQARDRRVEAGGRRQPGQLGVRHALRDEDRRQHHDPPPDPRAATSADTSARRGCPAPSARPRSSSPYSPDGLRSPALSASTAGPPRQARREHAGGDPDRRAGRHVARVVNAGVHARVGNGARERHEHRREHRQLGARAGDKRERRGGVTGWERRRSRHADERGPLARRTAAAGARAASPGRSPRPPRSRARSGRARPPSVRRAAEHGERSRDDEPQPRVVRGSRDRDEGAIQHRRACPKRASHQPAVEVLHAMPDRHLLTGSCEQRDTYTPSSGSPKTAAEHQPRGRSGSPAGRHP